MARSTAEIKKVMTDVFIANPTIIDIYELDGTKTFEQQFSIVSLESILFGVVAYATFLFENLFSTHKSEVEQVIQNDKAHRPSWYKTKALAFQFGFLLIPDTDMYDNTGYTADQIAASKVIKYAAITKSGGQLYIKIATETAGVLAPIASGVKDAFDHYIDEIADCGVKYLVVNHLPDRLTLGIKIFRNPLVLNESGMRLGATGGYYPVQDAINEYLKELPFNGELVLAHLVDKLQKVEGVEIPHIYNATSQSIDINSTPQVYLEPQYIDVKTVPVAGYFTIQNFNNITYVV